jgi:DNA modification methylase
MNRVIFGDCRETMRDLKAQGVRVQCCVTSPPYFGLRDYGHPGQIGLEKTPAEYVAALVEVFEGVRELLADDGVLWLNLGDSYATQGGRGEARMEELGRPSEGAKTEGRWRGATSGTKMPQGMKPKNLLGIPWRVAFALQAAGWYLRQDIIWHKPNPMPESVTDRCTKAHEYLFLLTKSERYYFDSKAMREPAAGGASKGNGQRLAERAVARTGGVINGGTAKSTLGTSADETRNRRSVWTVPTQPYTGAHFAVFPAALIEPCVLAGSRPGDVVLDPFMGSGTTAQVAQALGRQWIGCELNTEYAPLQQARTAQAALAT